MIFRIKGNVAVTVDDDNAGLAELHPWEQLTTGHIVARAVDSDGQPLFVVLHRLIAGDPDGLVVVHLNGNPLDNRRENLGTKQYKPWKGFKKGLTRANSSGVRGVNYCDKSSVQRPWRATIHVDKRNFLLGYFSDVTEAAAMRRAVEKCFFGEPVG